MKPQLIAAFEESLRDAPDQESVLIGLRTGLERHRQRRRRARVTLATAAVVTLVVISVVAVFSIRQRALPPAEPVPVPIQEWPSTIQLNWVPDGMSLVRKSTGETSETQFYSAGRQFMLVTVDKVDLNRNPSLAGWEQTVVNGRPGRYFVRDTQAAIIFQLPSGRWANVKLGLTNPGQGGGLTTLGADIAHVSATIREVAGPPVRNSFELTYLPPGQRVIGRQNGPVDLEKFGGINASAGTLQLGGVQKRPQLDNIYDEYREPDLGVGLDISVGTAVRSLDGWEKVADIQGQPAYRKADRDMLLVPNFHGGTLAVVPTFNGIEFFDPHGTKADLVPLTEMIKVAQGVRWVG